MLDLLRLLLPRACPGCGAQLGRARGLCAQCQASLVPVIEIHSPLSALPAPHLVSLGMYRGILRRSVRALKYSGARDLARPLGLALASAVPANWQIHAVVPVPAHFQRERMRGYNQSELLAKVIADQLNVPLVQPLKRVRHTKQQAKQHAKDRAANLVGAFAVIAPVPSGSILLVDDVMTTGATLMECRSTLLAAGAGELRYAVVAR